MIVYSYNGKRGSGKTSILKKLDAAIKSKWNAFGRVERIENGKILTVKDNGRHVGVCSDCRTVEMVRQASSMKLAKWKEFALARNRQSVRKAGDGRGDPTAEALSYKQVSRSASEPSLLRLVIVKTPCGQRIISREAEKKRRSRFAARKAWRGIEGRRVWKVALGTWEVCGAKALQKSDEVIVALKRCNDRGAKGLYLQNETIRIASREESNGRKAHQRGQSALGRRVGNRSAVARSVRWNQCETRPKGIGERDQ